MGLNPCVTFQRCSFWCACSRFTPKTEAGRWMHRGLYAPSGWRHRHDACSSTSRVPSKLQSRWQGPFIVVKCLQGNTYRIKLASNFRKRFLRHRDQLRVHHTRPARLHPTQSDNTMGQPTGVPGTVSPGQATAEHISDIRYFGMSGPFRFEK